MGCIINVLIRKKKSAKYTLYSFIIFAAAYFLYTLDHQYNYHLVQTPESNPAVVIPSSELEKNVYTKIKNKESVRTLIIGDSIGEGAGAANSNETWFARLTASLAETYQVTNFNTNLSIGGASVLGGWADYNLNKNYIKDHYDLVFICFGQNDQGVLPATTYNNLYEALIREIKEKTGNPEIFLIIENAISDETFPANVMKLAAHYDLGVIDSRLAFVHSGIPVAELSPDGVHPSSKGQELYHTIIMDTIRTNLQNSKKVTYNESAGRLYVNSASYKIFNFNFTYSIINGFSSKEGSSVGVMKGDSLDAVVIGTSIGVAVMQSPEGGKFDVYVDDTLITQLDSYAPSSRRNTFLIGDRFAAGSHQVIIQVNGKKTDESKGTKVEILGFPSNSK